MRIFSAGVMLATGPPRNMQYAMWERGELLPSQKPNSWMGCPCGERFDSHDPAGSYVHRRHIYTAQAVDGMRR
jgi:hypothetical protein